MKLKALLSALSLIATAQTAQSATLDISITNLTHGIYFTPILISAHDDSTHLFELGASASTALQEMAEGGAIGSLVSMVDAAGGVNVENPAAGLLAPATSTVSTDFETGALSYLSVTAMILPTNDGFMGVDAWPIPSAPGTYTILVNAYDAGTEANDEIVNGGGDPGVPGIPANPGGNGGTGAMGVTATEFNTSVHIHRGSLGDTSLTDGVSDLDSRIHRWLNPVAKVVVTVK